MKWANVPPVREVVPQREEGRPRRWFASAALEQLAWRVGFASDTQRLVLDVPASVRATANAGGMIDVVYRPGRKTSTLCVAHPTALNPAASAMLRCFVDGMRARGVTVETTTDTLADPADLTLVLVDACRPGDSHAGVWARRPHVSFIEVRDAGLWGDEVRALPRTPFSFDAEGIAAALDAARTERPPPKPSRSTQGTDRERLGRATRLAVACSLCAPFDLAVADALRRRFTPRLGFLAVQRVLNLDGVTGDVEGWQMKPALHAWLRDPQRCDADFAREVLLWQRDRIAQTPAPDGSRAAATRAEEVAWLTLRAGGLNNAKALAAWLDVMEASAQHPALKAIFEARLREARKEGAVTLPALGDDYEDRMLLERLAGLGLAAHDPVTLAWPKRWPRLAVESGVAALALVAAVVATLTIEMPRTTIWSGARSREIGETTGRPFSRTCERWSLAHAKAAEAGRGDGLVCGREPLNARLPPFMRFDLTAYEQTIPSNGVYAALNNERPTGLRGRKRMDLQGVTQEIVVTNLVRDDEPGGRARAPRPQLRDEEDFLLDCGPTSGIAGIYGHVSADGQRVVGLGIVCREIVPRDVP